MTRTQRNELKFDQFRLSPLFYYQNDEPLSERLKEVSAEWQNIQQEGLSKYFIDQMAQSEKLLLQEFTTAEKYAEDILRQGAKEEAKWIKKGIRGIVGGGSKKQAGDDFATGAIRNNGDDGAMPAMGSDPLKMMRMKQDFEEVRAAKVLGEAMGESVKMDVLVEKRESTGRSFDFFCLMFMKFKSSWATFETYHCMIIVHHPCYMFTLQRIGERHGKRSIHIERGRTSRANGSRRRRFPRGIHIRIEEGNGSKIGIECKKC